MLILRISNAALSDSTKCIRVNVPRTDQNERAKARQQLLERHRTMDKFAKYEVRSSKITCMHIMTHVWENMGGLGGKQVVCLRRKGTHQQGMRTGLSPPETSSVSKEEGDTPTRDAYRSLSSGNK